MNIYCENLIVTANKPVAKHDLHNHNLTNEGNAGKILPDNGSHADKLKMASLT